MNNPFTLLGVAEEADDETVRKAYLEAVRRHPPEREPERFQAVRTAYETIATQRGRLKFLLFGTPAPDLEALYQGMLIPGQVQPLTAGELLTLLGEALGEYRLAESGEENHGR